MTNSNSTQTAAPGGNRVYQYFDRVCSKIENTEFNATVYISVVMLVGFCRVIFEVLFQGEVALDMDDLCNWPALYLVLVPVFVVWMSPLLKMPREKLFNIVLVGTLFGVLPPVYDIFLTGWWKATYAYHLQTPWHFYAPPALPLGEAATVWSTIVFTTAYIAFRSKSIIKTLAGIFLSWLSLWVLSQSYLYALYLFKLMRFSDEHMMGDRPLTFLYILISLFAYILFNYQRFKYSFKRILHCLPWFFLTLIGGKLVGNVASITVLLGFVVSLFFMMVMIQNDYYDKESDKINKRESRINQQDVDFFHYLMLWLAIFFYFVTGTWLVTFLLFIFQIITLLYHHPSTYFKKVFPISYFIEGGAATIAVAIGCMIEVGGPKNITRDGYIIMICLLLVFLGFSCSSPMKDYKDIEGDRATDTDTLYVLWQKWGGRIETAHLLITINLIICNIVPLILVLERLGLALTIGYGLVISVLFYLAMTQIKDKFLTVEAGLVLVNFNLLFIFLFFTSPF